MKRSSLVLAIINRSTELFGHCKYSSRNLNTASLADLRSLLAELTSS